SQVPLRTALKLILNQLDLTYLVRDGLLTIISKNSEDQEAEGSASVPDVVMDEGVGEGVGTESSQGAPQARGGALLNQAAATVQAEELRVADGQGSGPPSDEKDSPSVTFSVAGRFNIPSRRDPQLLEVARVELPAEYHAKAVPVLTPRVYRL